MNFHVHQVISRYLVFYVFRKIKIGPPDQLLICNARTKNVPWHLLIIPHIFYPPRQITPGPTFSVFSRHLRFSIAYRSVYLNVIYVQSHKEQRMCLGTFSRLRRSLATSTLYAEVCILAERFLLYRNAISCKAKNCP